MLTNLLDQELESLVRNAISEQFANQTHGIWVAHLFTWPESPMTETWRNLERSMQDGIRTRAIREREGSE